ATRSDFALTAENAPVVAAVCARLDGLPLAIELAAARLKLFRPEQLLARLQNRLPLLTGGAQDLPERQRTLEATIAWSYDLLTPGEQQLIRRLAAFSGGWTLEAAEAVCRIADFGGVPATAGRFADSGSQSAIDVLDGISLLLDKSLVR